MKALFIGHIAEEDKPIIRLFSNNFPKIKLIGLKDINELVDEITGGGPYSFVVINIDNKDLKVPEIYNTINETIGERPFVFIGSPNSVKSQLTTELLNKHETCALIETPLDVEEFKKGVKIAIDWVRKEEFEESISEFSKDDLHPMRLRNFYLFDVLPYDVYVELTSTKYGKVISRDKPYTHHIIQNYSRRGIKHLYLKKDDHLKFLDNSIKNLIKIYESKLTDKKKYITLHLKTAYFIHQFIKVVSVSEDINKLVHLYSESVALVVKSFENISELLELTIDSNNMTFAEQTVATSYLCEKILTNMGWSADMTRGKLILASLIQDISLSNDDLIKIRSLNDPNFKMFSEQEQEEFKLHPSKAAEISRYFTGFSDVDFILLEQHENPSGDGFPKGLNSSGLTSISCVFILACNYVSRFSSTSRSPTQHRDIFQNIKRLYNTGNFKDPLKALEKSLKNHLTGTK